MSAKPHFVWLGFAAAACLLTWACFAGLAERSGLAAERRPFLPTIPQRGTP